MLMLLIVFLFIAFVISISDTLLRHQGNNSRVLFQERLKFSCFIKKNVERFFFQETVFPIHRIYSLLVESSAKKCGICRFFLNGAKLLMNIEFSEISKVRESDQSLEFFRECGS